MLSIYLPVDAAVTGKDAGRAKPFIGIALRYIRR
jgi:hypothetical protein